MRLRSLVSAIAVLGLAVGLSMQSAQAQMAKGEPVRLPHLTTFSGPAASWGETMLKAAQIAAGMINEKGGVHGRPLEFYAQDAPYDRMPEAMTMVKKVARDPSVLVIFDCGGATTVVAAAHDVVGKAGIPCFGLSSAGHWRKPSFNPYVFRLLPQAATAMPVLAPKIFKKHNVKKVAVAYTHNDEAPAANAQFVQGMLKELGIPFITVTGMLKEPEYRSQVTKIKSEEIDLVTVTMQPEDAGLFVRQLRADGVNLPVMGSAGLTDTNFADLAKGHVGTVYTYGVYDPKDPRPYVQNFIKRFNADVGRDPGVYEAIAGDAAFIVATIMNAAKELTREAIREAWSQTEGVETFTGRVSWEGSGEAIREQVLEQMYDADEKLVTIPASYWAAGS
jgi:branched-chain amino acid transport system substrate-binding protein